MSPRRNISDTNGRAFEYMLVEALEKNLNVQLTPRTQKDQLRDADKPDLIDLSIKRGFDQSIQRIIPWVSSQSDTSASLMIDRFPDTRGQQGDVTDIRISNACCELNLSLKHNHYALKHQRPPTLCTQMGFAAHGPEDTSYRQAYRQALDGFLLEANRLLPGATLFRDLETAQPGFKDQHLHLPVCSLIHKTYVQYAAQPGCAEALFSFLVGNTGFYKIVVAAGGVEVFDFQNIQLPSSFQSCFNRCSPSYVMLSFNNDWALSLRLHTASSRITKSVSLKFDTQFPRGTTIPVAREVL